MEEVKQQIHEHPLLPITRFSGDDCKGCGVSGTIYGGYRCNELGCGSVFHRECAESSPEITHSSHPDHPLKLFQSDEDVVCSRCGTQFKNGYICSICDFKLDLRCAKGTGPLLILENSDLHRHPLELFSSKGDVDCKICSRRPSPGDLCYNCDKCELVFHVEYAEFFPEANHTSHPQHPLKFLILFQAPNYADEKCLLCGIKLFDGNYEFHYCDVCNFSICRACMKNPPPVRVKSMTHIHELHLVPRRIDFTCNACGTLGDRSPYFCLQCNIMIHRECSNLPRVININRHDHRISYTSRLGHGEDWKCKVCRGKVDGFYGAYTCVKCPSFAVHSLCAMRKDIWGEMSEEEEIASFEVIDDNTIKHFSHGHSLLRINKDDHGRIHPKNIVCEACRLQISSEVFYSCERCNFILHEKCVYHPAVSNLPFTHLDSRHKFVPCWFCHQFFTGLRYKAGLYMIIDVRCATTSDTLEHQSHQHPLYYYIVSFSRNLCSQLGKERIGFYSCDEYDYTLDDKCANFPEANHTSHPQHPLKRLAFEAAADYTDENCLLCRIKFDYNNYKLHHCDVCNFSICGACMKNPPPVVVDCPTTHEHKLHLFPRRIDFTCNACGTVGDHSPYSCFECNFMIHQECIDLPRVININHHDHRISYTRRLGHGEWKCKVCRKKVDGFYGAYTCVKCPSFAVHSLCATRKDVWDMIEREWMPEEKVIPPFEVINDNTIKHFSHAHNLLRINKDGHDRIQPENIVCEACCLQILSEPFYSCEQCDFILHDKCANHPRKKRHVINNLPFTLLTDSRHEVDQCKICQQYFTGFRYKSGSSMTIDVRCAAISDTLEHGSHRHPLYFDSTTDKYCSRCGRSSLYVCAECDYSLDRYCAYFPKKVMKNRYDDHPLFLSFGDWNVDNDYWCEACEKKVNPREWFYTCNDCGTTLHIPCVVGDFSYIRPGSVTRSNEEVVSNTSICRSLCSGCNSRCMLHSLMKNSTAGTVSACSLRCNNELI